MNKELKTSLKLMTIIALIGLTIVIGNIIFQGLGYILPFFIATILFAIYEKIWR
tara:strand:- start:429 stop:590 length:162 start_codon:yes stop_codon:yes gene_type:complete